MILFYFQLFNILAYICAEVTQAYGRSFHQLIAVSSIWITGILLFVHSTDLNILIKVSTLAKIEVSISIIFVCFYCIAMFWSLITFSGLAAFFAFFSIQIYSNYGILRSVDCAEVLGKEATKKTVEKAFSVESDLD